MTPTEKALAEIEERLANATNKSGDWRVDARREIEMLNAAKSDLARLTKALRVTCEALTQYGPVGYAEKALAQIDEIFSEGE